MTKKMTRPKIQNSQLINGFWITNDQIKFWEEAYGGKLVTDPRANGILLSAAKEHSKRGKTPGPMRVRELWPFKWFIPIRVEAEIIGVGGIKVPTNQFIFIEVKKVM